MFRGSPNGLLRFRSHPARSEVHRSGASAYGRFLTTDPARNSAVLEVPGSWNSYAYAYGDPAGSNDPTGLFGETDEPGYCDENPDDPACQYPCNDDHAECQNPTPVSPTPPQATCTIGLYERRAFSKYSKWGHTFIVLDCSNWDGTNNPVGGLTLDGDPGRVPVAGQPLQQSGWTHAPWLVGFVSPVGTALESRARPTAPK
jgi:hypothetical protein